MVEVVFSDSAKASIRIAQSHDAKAAGKGTIGFIGKKPARAEVRHAIEGEALGGDTRDCLGLSLYLDIGDISNETDHEARRRVLYDMFRRPFETAAGIEATIREFLQGSLADLDRLIARARSGEAVRIWYSDAPHEACGFCHVVSVLKDIDCEITAVKLPQSLLSTGEVVQHSCWGEVDPREFYKLSPNERPLQAAERNSIAQEWARLKQENSPLRAMVNGRLTSVDEDFYDFLIRRELPEGETVMARLVGNILLKNPIGVGDWWYIKRINLMLAYGELEVVRADADEYLQVLKRI